MSSGPSKDSYTRLRRIPAGRGGSIRSLPSFTPGTEAAHVVGTGDVLAGDVMAREPNYQTQKPRTVGSGRTRKRLPPWQLVPCDFPSLDTTTASGRPEG